MALMTGLGPFGHAPAGRYYFPEAHVRLGLLVRLPCGLHENVAWSYQEPRHDAEPVRGRIAFFDEHIDLEVDGRRQPRPSTPWAASRWWERIDRMEAQL
jgi:hypothetical protein